MARPTKHPDEKRDQRFNLRFTTAEIDHVETQARLAGLPPSEYLRRRALGYEVPSGSSRRVDPALVTELNRLALALTSHSAEVKAIGHNANQLAKASHLGRASMLAWEDVVRAVTEQGQRSDALHDQIASILERMVLGDS